MVYAPMVLQLESWGRILLTVTEQTAWARRPLGKDKGKRGFV